MYFYFQTYAQSLEQLEKFQNTFKNEYQETKNEESLDYLPLFVAGPIITKSKVKSDSTQSSSGSPRPVHKLHDYDNSYSKSSDSELPYLPLVYLIYT